MITMTLDEAQRLGIGGLGHRKATKYHNQHVKLDGHSFDSKAEAERYAELVMLQQAGGIIGLRVHPRFIVVAKDDNGPAIKYEADFQYIDSQGNEVVEDVKGGKATLTPVFRLKFRLCQARWPSVHWEVVER